VFRVKPDAPELTLEEAELLYRRVRLVGPVCALAVAVPCLVAAWLEPYLRVQLLVPMVLFVAVVGVGAPLWYRVTLMRARRRAAADEPAGF
jgi:hypothetical protein